MFRRNLFLRAIPILVMFVCSLIPSHAGAQNPDGFIYFSGTVSSVTFSPYATRVESIVDVFTAPMLVVLDEVTTLTGSLGGRSSAQTLAPGLFVEVEGWMGTDWVVRASNVHIKVQSGAVRMYGQIENILQRQDATSLIIDGIEVRVDGLSVIVVNRDGLAAPGPVTELRRGDFVDVTASFVNNTGIGQTTSGLFHANSIVVQRSFRIQGQLRSRIPAEGTPTVIVVEGIVVTITPDTVILGNGLNERNEAFVVRKNPQQPIRTKIEDDAGNPCTTTPNGCPDSPPTDATKAGDLRIGAFVRVEGMLESTGFSTRYTARTIQVERANQLRFHAVVENQSATVLSVRINEQVQTQVTLDSSTQIDGPIARGRLIEISGRFNADMSILARRVKVIQ